MESGQPATGTDTVSSVACPRSSKDRVSDFGSEGWRFESVRGYQYFESEWGLDLMIGRAREPLYYNGYYNAARELCLHEAGPLSP